MNDQERIKRLEQQLRDYRNELCLRCGQYKMRHEGACDGCRWKDLDKIREVCTDD